ncbi:MAG: 30S ribosome-binding factor RbfA [Thiomargarita sp.]|nr:30S ribosome-binding factor RbfA [Thiomargarita sp.]
MKRNYAEFSRTERVAEQVKRELSSIIQKEVSQANLGMITVSMVDISPDLKQARIHITIFNQETELTNHKSTITYLNSIAKHLRYHLSQQLNLRVTPELRFTHDASIAQASQLLSLIDSLAVDK